MLRRLWFVLSALWAALLWVTASSEYKFSPELLFVAFGPLVLGLFVLPLFLRYIAYGSFRRRYF